MTHSPPFHQFTFSKHRLEGLTDAIFAAAMTLLVIELKIPETAHISSQAGLISTYVTNVYLVKTQEDLIA